MAFPPHPSLTAMDGVSTPTRMNDMTEKLDDPYGMDSDPAGRAGDGGQPGSESSA